MREYMRNLFAARGAAFWLNLLGLTLAFVIFYVLMAEVMWHVTFDRFHKDADRVCQVFWHSSKDTAKVDFSTINAFHAANAQEVVNMTDAIEASATIYFLEGSAMFADSVRQTKGWSVNMTLRHVSPGLFDVFTFDFLEGGSEALRDPDNVFIPLSFAKQLFGEEGPYLGKRCHVTSRNDRKEYDVYIGGVYRDFTNSNLPNNAYQLISPERLEKALSKEGREDHYLFVKLREGVDKEKLSNDLLAGSAKFREKASGFSFIPLSETYYLEDSRYEQFKWRAPFMRNGNREIPKLLLGVALLVLVVACINYVNFALAMVPYQIKSINVRRILGEKAWPLRWSLIGQAFLNVALAGGVSLVVINLCIKNGWVDEWLKCDLAFVYNGHILLMMLGVLLLVPIVAGGYPAWYTTSRRPALVVNGSFALSPAGRAFRRMLIGFQFIISFVFIILLSLISSQNHYLYNAPVGYARDSVVYIQPNNSKHWGKIPELEDALRSHPDVAQVACGHYLLGEDNFSGWGVLYEGKNTYFKVFPVRYDFLSAMGINVREGRDFRAEDEGQRLIIVNETARKQYGLKLNTSVDGLGEIVGVTDDIRYGSFKTEIIPIAFALGQGWGRQIVVRLHSPEKAGEFGHFVEEQTQKMFGDSNLFTYWTKNSIADNTYHEEQKQLKLLMLVSVISLVIPLIGVFGLVLFETRAKRKEIGVRKVFGATTRGILRMFNMHYLRMLIVCFVIAAPVAYYLYNIWIESFAYRTPMHWWLFGVAFLIVALIVCLTVTVQSWRAAKERPVEVLMK